MTRELIAAVMLFLTSSASMSGRNVTLESDVDKAAAIIFSDGSPRATLVVGTSKACEQIKLSHKQSAKDKITLLFSDNTFSHFLQGHATGNVTWCN